MNSIGPRILKIENHFKELKGRQTILDIREPWKKINPDDLNMIKNAVETFSKLPPRKGHFGNLGERVIENDFDIIPADASTEERNRLLMKNFATLLRILIISFHREDFDLLDEVRKYPTLSIPYRIAEDIYKKRAVSNYSSAN